MRRLINRILTISLQKKIIFAFIVFILIPFLTVNIYSYWMYENIIINKLNLSMQKSLQQSKNNIENLINEVYSVSNVISQSIEISDILNNEADADNNQRIQDEKKIKEILNNIKRNIFSVYADIILIDKNGNVFSTRLTEKNSYAVITTSQWFKKINENKGNNYWFTTNSKEVGFITNKNGNVASNVSDNVIAMGNVIQGKNERMDLGVIVITINEEELYKIFGKSDLFNKDTRFILSDNGIIISNSDKDLIFKPIDDSSLYKQLLEKESGYSINTMDKDRFLINYQTIKSVDWKLFESIPYSWMFNEIYTLRTKVIIISIVIFIIFTFVVYFFTKVFISPLKVLEKLMKKVEEGNLNVKFDLKLNDEIAVLGNSFNSMVDNLKLLIDENYLKQLELSEKEKTKEKLKYKVLQSQINPHFLFNTLNSIKWMAIINNAPKVADSIASLGHLLEAGIKRMDDEITVREELVYLQEYIDIMQLIHANKFDFQLDVKDEILDLKVLKLLLQPIVENAIIHGISKIKGRGKIQVIGYKKFRFLIFEIIDNGIGITSDAKRKLLSNNEEPSSGKFNSLGINSIIQRIKTNYGSEYGLNIKSRKNDGTNIIIYLPVLKPEIGLSESAVTAN